LNSVNGTPIQEARIVFTSSLTTLAGGGHQLNGGVQRMRLVLGLAPAGG
jgi:hypothetical protein